MNRLIERCAVLDVHKSQITACVRVPDDDGGRRQEIREFRTTTAGLLTLADWLRKIDFLDETVATLSERVEELTRPFSRELELLDTIPGVDKRAAEMLLAEIGPNMSRFPTEAHLASWGGMCPGQRQSGGKKQSARTRKGSKWLRGTLTECSKAVVRTKGTYLSARHHRIKSRRGHAKATVGPATRSSPPPTTSSTKAPPTTSSARSSSTAETQRTPNATAAG